MKNKTDYITENNTLETNSLKHVSNSRKRLPKPTKILLGILAGGIVGLAICFLLSFLFLRAFFLGPKPTVYEGAGHYDKIYENRIHSGLMLFPETISPSAEHVDFYYFWRDTFNFPTAQIHLSCSYPPQEYEQEVSRISTTSKQIGLNLQKVYFDDCRDFQYPAYVAVSGNNIWEYALLLEDTHTIHYIFTEYCSSDDVHFDTAYLPGNFDDNSRLEFGEDFSIYEYSVRTDGEVTAVDDDYSRSAVIPQTQCHYVDSGQYSFSVYTDLDKEGTETITGCTLYYFDASAKRGQKSQEQSWDFTELNQQLFKELSLSKDRSQAIITCEDSAGEKEIIFDIAAKKFLVP